MGYPFNIRTSGREVEAFHSHPVLYGSIIMLAKPVGALERRLTHEEYDVPDGEEGTVAMNHPSGFRGLRIS
jgi:hypothetical protein